MSKANFLLTLIYWTQIVSIASGLIWMIFWGMRIGATYDSCAVFLVIIFSMAEVYRRYIASKERSDFK